MPPSESFHSTLEFELLRKHHFATRAEARGAVAAYIDRYNRIRRHSSCEMHSPIEYEAILAARGAETVHARGGGVKTGLHDRRSSHAQRSGGTRHRADDKLNQQSAALHDSGGGPERRTRDCWGYWVRASAAVVV